MRGRFFPIRLDHLVEPVSPAGRVFGASVQVLIVLSIVSFCIETLPDLSPGLRGALASFEVVCVTLFSIEYVLRLMASRPWRTYAFSFFGLVDLLAILPFFLTLLTTAFVGVDLRSIRLFRAFRLIRLLKLVRYSAAAQRFAMAFRMIRAELALLLVACVFLLFVSSVGIYYFESAAQPEQFGSIFHCMWWSVSTLTTVGYGDVYPITLGGRMFTSVILFIGLGVVAVPAGLVAGALSRTMRDDGAIEDGVEEEDAVEGAEEDAVEGTAEGKDAPGSSSIAIDEAA